MPKIKSNRSASKRFKVTKSGKVVRGKALKRHLLTGKPRKAKRQRKGNHVVDPADAKRIMRLIHT
jgi:large subunit ribosomal protein L35